MKSYPMEIEEIGISSVKIWTRIYDVLGYARVKKGKNFVADHGLMEVVRNTKHELPTDEPAPGGPYTVKIPLPIHEWRKIFDPAQNLMLCVTKTVKTHNN